MCETAECEMYFKKKVSDYLSLNFTNILAIVFVLQSTGEWVIKTENSFSSLIDIIQTSSHVYLTLNNTLVVSKLF